MNKRWRASNGKSYYAITVRYGVFIVIETSDGGGVVDDYRHAIGNYFQTEKEAEEALYLFQETLKEYHQNKINKDMEANPIRSIK